MAFDTMTEKQIHAGLSAYLRKNGLSFVAHRMDRRSGIKEGWPDITIIHAGRACLLELKTAKGKLSPQQVTVSDKLRKNGTIVHVARSVEQAIAVVETWLGIEKPHHEPPSASTGHLKATGAELAPERLTQGKTEPFYITNWSGKEFVVTRNKVNGNFDLVRQASAADHINYPRF